MWAVAKITWADARGAVTPRVLKLLRLAARAGNRTAMWNLGGYYMQKRDQHQAVPWLTRAAKAGSRHGFRGLVEIYRRRPGKRKFARKLARAGARAGSARCQEWLGLYYLKKARYKRAFPLLKQAWLQVPRAVGYNLACMYLNGDGTPRNVKAAVRILRVSALAGSAGSAAELASIFYRGTGVPRDYRRAFRWIHCGARLGKLSAMWTTASLYRHGIGVHQSAQMSRYWLARYRMAKAMRAKAAGRGAAGG